MNYRLSFLRALHTGAVRHVPTRSHPRKMFLNNSGFRQTCFLPMTIATSASSSLRHSVRCFFTRQSLEGRNRLSTASKYMATLSSSPSPSPSPSPPSSSSHTKTSHVRTDAERKAIAIEKRPLRKGDLIDVTITRIGYGGTSVGHISSVPFLKLVEDDLTLPVYTPTGACPGDIIRCTVTRVRRRIRRANGDNSIKPPPDPSDTAQRAYAEAAFTEMLTPSPQSITPVPCKHFGHFKLNGGGCGGCTAMHIPYEMQLEQKNVQMQVLYANLANRQREQQNEVDAPLLKIAPIVPCDDTFRYRNKMEFTFGRRWLTEKEKLSSTDNQNKDDVEIRRKYALGLHVPQRFDKVVEISDCHIYPAIGNEILELIRETANDMLLEPYDTKTDTGYLRNVGIRTATNTHGKMEVMVNLITSECEVPERLVPLAQALKSRFPEVVCVVQNMRGVQGRGLHEIDESNERLLVGDRPYIEQSVNGITFRISANSFFQTNPRQSEILFNNIVEAAKLASDSDVVLDLFCGTGSIGLSLARYAKYVHGIDIVSSAVADANMNATINGISNASFVEMNLDKVKEMARKELLEIPKANVIVVDPPRAGLHPDLVKYLARADHVERIVYVSCNPLTQIRDIMELMHLHPNTFHVTSVQPIDMFPNTHHVECVVGIEKRAQ